MGEWSYTQQSIYIRNPLTETFPMIPNLLGSVTFDLPTFRRRYKVTQVDFDYKSNLTIVLLLKTYNITKIGETGTDGHVYFVISKNQVFKTFEHLYFCINIGFFCCKMCQNIQLPKLLEFDLKVAFMVTP